jgi:hypothetical protein
LSRAALAAALAGLLLGSTACSGPTSQVALGTPLPAHHPILANGLDVTVDDVSPVATNTDGSQEYVATYTVSSQAGSPEPKTFRAGEQVLFADGKQYAADDAATMGLSNSGLVQILNGGTTQQSKVVFDIPAGVKITGAGVYVGDDLWRINLAS